MKVLQLSTSDIDGGAARAAYRLHQGLLISGVDSSMLVRAYESGDDSVVVEKTLMTRLGPMMNGLPLRRYKQRSASMFSPQWFPDSLTSRVNALNPDILALHWICNGFVQIETLARLNKPMIWLVHDMWPFTGGCHYAQDCDRYTQSCGACPQLNSQSLQDLSHQIWQRKAKAWRDINLTLVAPSHWFAEVMGSSSLFQNRRIEVIPHGIDLEQYRPLNPSFARDVLKLPQNKLLVLFGASSGVTNDPRKGFHLLQAALQQLSQNEWADQLEIVIFGINTPPIPPNLGFPTHYIGKLRDEVSLVLTYSAADVMVVPSLQESFGQTASESLACGTPVVAFDATGLKDIVDHQKNGYLAQPYCAEDLAKGIAWVLQNSDHRQTLIANAREKAVQAFSLHLQAQRYEALFQDLLKA